MDIDDPRQPLLGCRPNSRWRDTANRFCNLESWKRRLPITIWLPSYSLDYLLRDAIAGITVGLTSIPQGIAYAMLAGLPPQAGLYSSIFPGIVYTFLGSCKDVTVGPTAILAALLAKYVAQSPDFAYLAAFLSGLFILLLGVLQLGFLLDFISKPVISGFTTAAALQIGASQLKSLFSVSGSSGGTFIQSLISFFENIKTVQLWDTLLGVFTILSLLLLKHTTVKAQASASRCRAALSSSWAHVVRARNALVVLAGSILAYCLHLYGITPFALTGTIHGGLPQFAWPPLATAVGNQTLGFAQMLRVLGPEGFAMPLVAVLESIAIAKAFARGAAVDASQEMVALGAGSVLAALARGMPAAGSFTRTTLNHASGVATPAGCLFKASTVLLAVTLLAEAFYFIPRAALAGIIMVAMAPLIELRIVPKLWLSSIAELAIWVLTVCVGVGVGLEYGIAAGAAGDALRALAAAARPALRLRRGKVGGRDVAVLQLQGELCYAGAARAARALRRAPRGACLVVLDAGCLRRADIGVVENLITTIMELEKQKHTFLLWNFDAKHQRLFESLQPEMASKFASGPDVELYITGLNERSDSTSLHQRL